MADGFIMLGSGIFLFIGLLFVLGAIHTLLRSLSMKNWRTSKAQVIDSKIESSSSSDSSTTYTAAITYSYDFNGGHYEKKSTSFSSSKRSEVSNLLSKYQKGAEIEVQINPSNPKDSEISTLAKPSFFIIGVLAVFGIVFCGAGLLVYYIFGTNDDLSSFDYLMNNFVGPLFAFFVGLIFIYIGYYLLKKDGQVSNSFIPTPATIVSSSISERSVEGKYNDGTRYSTLLYSPIIGYEYTFEKEKFEGEHSSYSTSNSSEANSIISNYPEGTKITVLVDPKDHSHSVATGLIVQSDYFAYIFIAVGVLALLIGIAIFFINHVA